MTAITRERLDEIRALDAAADRGPWRWTGNTDFPDSIRVENSRWVILGTDRRERTPEDREIHSYAEYLRDCSDDLTTKAERDDLEDAALDALRRERSLERAREEMLTDQWGQPATDTRLRIGGESGRGLAEELAIYQVARNQGLPDDTPADHPKVYRRDIVGLRAPNARMLAEGRQAVTDLLAEVDALRARLDAVAVEVNYAEWWALRWQDPLPVPEWVDTIRSAAITGAPRERAAAWSAGRAS